MQLAAGRVGARAQAWQKSKKIQGRLYEWQYEGWMQCSALCVAHFAAFKKTFSSSLAIDVQACMSLGLAKTSFISYHISYHLLFTTAKITIKNAVLVNNKGSDEKEEATKTKIIVTRKVVVFMRVD